MKNHNGRLAKLETEQTRLNPPPISLTEADKTRIIRRFLTGFAAGTLQPEYIPKAIKLTEIFENVIDHRGTERPTVTQIIRYFEDLKEQD